MVVHIGEMYTDIRPAEPEAETGTADGRSGSGRTAEETWDESRGRLTWLQARTAATGFDD
jgi:hypothetical protein